LGWPRGLVRCHESSRTAASICTESSSELLALRVVKGVPAHGCRVALAKKAQLHLRPFGGVIGRQISIGDALPDRVAVIGAGDVAEYAVAVEDRLLAHDHNGGIVERQTAQPSAEPLDPQ